MGDINLSSNDRVPRRFLGVRYEPNISMGTLLVMAGFAIQAIFFWAGVEHRLTSNEKDISYVTKTTDGWHQEALVVRQGFANDIGGLRQSVGQLSERVDLMTSRK